MRVRIETYQLIYIGMTEAQATELSWFLGAIGEQELTAICGKITGTDPELRSIKETLQDFRRAINDAQHEANKPKQAVERGHI